MAFPIDMLRMRKAGATLLDTQTVTNGRVGTTGNRTYGYMSGSIGSISDGTSNLYGGAVINRIDYSEVTANMELRITGTLANSGWTSMVIGSSTYLRASASFAQAGGNTTWTWPGANDFGVTIGTIVPVYFY